MVPLKMCSIQSMKESEVKNALLVKQLAQKDTEISHLKTEATCKIQNRIENYIDKETKARFNRNLIILDKILSNSRYSKYKKSLAI